MTIFIDEILESDMKDYGTDEMPKCPVCGAKAYIHHDIVDGMDWGWSVGCPRYRHCDGIHGTTPNTPEEDLYSIHCLNSKTECKKKWKERVKHLERQRQSKE